jgi:hypothetical protein
MKGLTEAVIEQLELVAVFDLAEVHCDASVFVVDFLIEVIRH